MALTDAALRVLVRMGCRSLPARHLEWVANRLVQRMATELQAREALAALLRLDQKVYKLEGPAAIRHEGGVHPKHRLTDYHQFFVDHLRSGERVLDVGCGSGLLAFDLAEAAGAEVVGLEINPDSVAWARRERSHARIQYVLGDVYQVIPAGPFDVVVLSNLLEHLRDRDAVLARLQATVSPSRFLIRVPLFERDWRVPLKRELGLEWRLDPTHETEYTVESFRTEMHAAGLSVVGLQVRWGEIWAVVAKPPVAP